MAYVDAMVNMVCPVIPAKAGIQSEGIGLFLPLGLVR
jgi:hypothetical protein